ncbi:MAG: HDOD domain-containing protein [Mucispirillum sp.]|nr:HDOD domain-containing protein [Mucispirillum sp.]
MNIRFIGSEGGLRTFKKLLEGKASVSAKEDARDALIFEVPSLEVLYKIPKRSFGIPTFFYITTPNKSVLSHIKDYRISGIFFPPLNAASILTKLGQAQSGLSSQVNAQDFETLRIKIIAKAENIPALPSIANDLIKLTSNNQAVASQITSKIKKDQGISSRVIKLVNSPFYGMRKEISSIDRATMLLGFGSVKNIALAISLDQYYQKPFNMYGTTGQAMWNHSYNVALISSALAKHLDQNEDALYMAGLMHDIGKVVMADFLVKEVECVQDERAQLGCDHAEIASVIMNKWSVSQSVTEAVRTHHDANPDIYGSIVAAANNIDKDSGNMDAYLEELHEKYPISNAEHLKESIISIISDENNAE